MSAELSKVESERDFLRRELDAVQDDNSGRQQDDQPIEDNLTMAERFRDLTESVRQKNQHITQLLNDIEVLIIINLIVNKSQWQTLEGPPCSIVHLLF